MTATVILGGTRSSSRATLDYRRRPPDQRALCAPGGWGTRPEQSPVRDPMDVFGPVRARDVRSLAGPVIDVQVGPATELIREGEPIGTFFVIRRGSALLLREGCGIETLATGACFGELDPRSAEPQGYAVVTLEPTRLLTFSAFGISRLCDAIPGMRKRIRDQLPDRTAEIHVLAPGRRAASSV